MGKIVLCSEFARAGRARLRDRIVEFCRSTPRGDEEAGCRSVMDIGRMIHAESVATYSLETTPEQLYPAPWLHVIGKLLTEHPDIPGGRDGLLRAVQCHLDSMANN